MIPYFLIGTIVLFVLTLIFYLVTLGLLYYWHERSITFVIVPMILTFEFFVAAFLIISFFVVFFQFLPNFLSLVQG